MSSFRCTFLRLSASVLACAVSASAQQPTPYVTGSTVTGHVICADNNAPARFARVLLKSTTPDDSGNDFIKSLQKLAAKSNPDAAKSDPQQQKQLAAAAHSLSQVTEMLNSTTVGLDGSFVIAGVKPGTYYVHAIYPGYIDALSQFSDEDLASTDPAVRARLAQLPTITVTGTDSARIDVRLDRGASIGGRMFYQDGSPASGWFISVIRPKSPEDPAEGTAPAMNQALAMSGAAQLFKTDDRGQYRISGLMPGDYAIRATLMATGIGINANNIGDGGSGIMLSAYTGDTFSRSEAKAIHISAGEDATGVDITVPSNKLHNIVGHVYAKSDSHALNAGSVRLSNADNPNLNLTAAIRDDGSFHFEYLPAGKYTVKVSDAADARNTNTGPKFLGMRMPNPEILRKYGTDSADVMLSDSDINDVHLVVVQTDWTPPAKKQTAAKPDITPGNVLDSLFSDDDSNTKAEKKQ